MIECISVVKSSNVNDFEIWLKYHLNIGFDFISIYDNDSTTNIKAICDQYENVSYNKVSGYIRQFKIYDEHFRNSKANWIMPIDSDEYLWLDFKNIQEALHYLNSNFHWGMYAIRWKHLFPKEFHSERNCPLLEYGTIENDVLASLFNYGDRGVKTIVKNDGNVHYQEREEIRDRGHIPIHSKYPYALTLTGLHLINNLVPVGKFNPQERIRLLHFRYTGYSEYKNKDWTSIGGEVPKEKKYKFTDILELLK